MTHDEPDTASRRPYATIAVLVALVFLIGMSFAKAQTLPQTAYTPTSQAADITGPPR